MLHGGCGVMTKYGGRAMSNELRVLVEVRAGRTMEQFAETGLPGFAPNPMSEAEQIRSDDDVWGDSGFRIRGTVQRDALDRLRRNSDVLGVYIDTVSDQLR